MSDIFRFDFNHQANTVSRMYEMDDGRWESESIRGLSFELFRAEDGGVEAVAASKVSKGVKDYTVYGDVDRDGRFVEALELEVVSAQVKGSKLDKSKFSFDAEGNVTQEFELKKGKWVLDRTERDESFDTIYIDGQPYVVKTENDRGSVEFEIFRDDNQDGVWTRIAEGEVSKSSDFFNPETGTLDLVGVQDLLGHADALVA